MSNSTKTLPTQEETEAQNAKVIRCKDICKEYIKLRYSALKYSELWICFLTCWLDDPTKNPDLLSSLEAVSDLMEENNSSCYAEKIKDVDRIWQIS